MDRISSTVSTAVHEVGAYINKLKIKKTKTIAPDNTTMLKLPLSYTVESLTYVYNLCIQQNVFPSALKTEKVIPLPEAKGVTDSNTFSPISFLSSLSKPIEKHIHKHLI